MLRRIAQLSVGLLVAFCPMLLSGQAAQPQYYVFCAAQAPPSAPGGVATVYYSGIMQGTAANLTNFRTDFTQFLMQKYAYKGAAACAPRTTMADAQTMMTNQETAFRNAKRNVVETGWTEGGAGGILGGGSGSNPLGSIKNPLGNILGSGQSNTPSNAAASGNQPKAGGQTTPGGSGGQAQAAGGSGQAQAGGRGGAGGGNGGGGNGGGNQSTFSSVFGQIFGTNGGSGGAGEGNGGGAKTGQGQPNANAKPGQGGPGGTGGTGGGGNGGNGAGNQSPFAQVSSVIFGNRGGGNGGSANNGGGRGGQPGQPGGGNSVAANNNAPKPGAPGQPTAPIGTAAPAAQPGVLGSAQFGTTKLEIYGCARQDMQVACVTELTNQNPKDTLVKSADIWKDAFVVDDRGDRHARTNAFFLNVDGEQRQQLDISNGKTAKFVLMFDQVPTKVQSVALRSQTGNMDVENIGLVAPDGSAPSATSASTPGAAPTPPPTQH